MAIASSAHRTRRSACGLPPVPYELAMMVSTASRVLEKCDRGILENHVLIPGHLRVGVVIRGRDHYLVHADEGAAVAVDTGQVTQIEVRGPARPQCHVRDALVVLAGVARGRARQGQV
jgi:hypothetical protein